MIATKDVPQAAPWRDTPLASPPLSRRAYRCLTEAGYRTLAEVAAAPREALFALPGFGAICLSEVRKLVKHARVEHGKALVAAGHSLRQAGTEAGIDPKTIRKYMTK